jgi:hypothetical protein
MNEKKGLGEILRPFIFLSEIVSHPWPPILLVFDLYTRQKWIPISLENIMKYSNEFKRSSVLPSARLLGVWLTWARSMTGVEVMMLVKALRKAGIR